MNLIEEISQLKKEKGALILAHTYQKAEIQDCADFVGDSYGLSVQASKAKSRLILFCGVRFMAETAAILNPDAEVILVEPDAGCPMADMIEPDDLVELKEKYPDHLVMCYVNSTVGIKALSDVCVTSSNAVKITNALPKEKGILFVPDKHLGDFVAQKTGRNMVLWNGFCPTHARIQPEMITTARKEHPNALVLIHPEAPRECRELADQVLSTGGMCDFVASSNNEEYIIATEIGIMHTLQKANPTKKFYIVSEKATCPNMKKGSLESVKRALQGFGGEVMKIDPSIASKARFSLTKMLDLAK